MPFNVVIASRQWQNLTVDQFPKRVRKEIRILVLPSFQDLFLMKTDLKSAETAKFVQRLRIYDCDVQLSILIWFWWRQLAAGRSLKFASFRGGWVECTCPRSAAVFHLWSTCSAWLEQTTSRLRGGHFTTELLLVATLNKSFKFHRRIRLRR